VKRQALFPQLLGVFGAGVMLQVAQARKPACLNLGMECMVRLPVFIRLQAGVMQLAAVAQPDIWRLEWLQARELGKLVRLVDDQVQGMQGGIFQR